MTLNNITANLVANVFPAGMQHSELVLQDEEGGSVVTELDELSSASEQNIAPAAINIENSKDVIIGPVTQFHGPVTVYQNVNGTSALPHNLETNKKYHQNGKLVKSESSSSDTSHAAEKPSKSLPYSKHLKYIGVPVVLLVIITIITCAVILSSKYKQQGGRPEQPPSTTFDTYTGQEDGDALVPIGSGSIITREEWHGHDPLNFTKPLAHPTPLVVVSHSVTPVCDTLERCSKRVQSIQEYHMNNLGSPDIGYNFLIGGDANVYVGRGWDIKNFHGSNSIGVCFIGNYITDFLTEAMINTTQALLQNGVDTGKLAEDYKLIGHNQTFDTLSPGRNVYRVIKTWPHFDERSYKRKNS